MTDEQIFQIKKAIMECRILYPDDEDDSKQRRKRQRRKGGVRKYIPYIIYFLLLLALGALLAFSNEDVRQKVLTSLFLQRLLSH